MNDTTFQGTGMVIKVPVIVGKPQKQTNADRIRSMTDAELAELFTGYYSDGPKFWCPAQPDIGEGECAKADDCRECFLNWLKQEAEK